MATVHKGIFLACNVLYNHTTKIRPNLYNWRLDTSSKINFGPLSLGFCNWGDGLKGIKGCEFEFA
jgi:hypothetical protein